MFVLPEITTGPERHLLEATMDRQRRAVIDVARGLSETDARVRLVASATTPIGLVKHAAMAERRWFQCLLQGLDESECDGPTTPGDPSFAVAEGETVADVIAEFERASARSHEIAARFDLDETRTHDVLGEVTLRFVYLLLIEDFARHAGHGDILREQLSER
ncbi:DinB family protein [Amycolatopsis eburnea]|uniref:DinB family protein n=1 Tax=Amycolatopsis eburnea TaxID=2267691 RepID=A0A3R9EYG8_9PSEU|nr:DinB family protein [Amycolatopsis eburnea]RSD07980.1 DinB family protein [Amycolatopsis eburnea]